MAYFERVLKQLSSDSLFCMAADHGTSDAAGSSVGTPSKVRRRTLAYALFQNVSFGTDRIGLPEKMSAQAALRAAVRAWSADKMIPIANLATPRQLGDDRWRLSAPCNKCDLCARGAGSVYQFTGLWEGHDGSVYSLTVDKAGQCLGEPKIARSPRKFKQDTTVAERDRIVAEAEELKSQGRACATSSVSMRLQGLKIPFVRIREVVKNLKKQWGPTAKTFRDSARRFAHFVDRLDDPNIKFELVETEPAVRWILVVQPMLQRIAEQEPKFLYITSDATHSLELLGHKYGLVSDSPLNMLFSCSEKFVVFFWQS